MTDPDPLLTAEDVSELLGVSVEALAQWRTRETGPPFLRLSRSAIRYRQSDVDAWLASKRVAPEEPTA